MKLFTFFSSINAENYIFVFVRTTIMKKEIQILSDIKNLRLVENLVDEVAKEIGIQNSAYGNFLVSVIEAVNNSIVHGNKQDPSKYVHVTIEKEGGILKVSVSDEGNGFDYLSLPDPTAPGNVENISGRGIFLMKTLADKVDFEENGAKVNMEFNIA